MPQKGLKKVMGLGEAEKTFLKSFFRFPKFHPLSRRESKEAMGPQDEEIKKIFRLLDQLWKNNDGADTQQRKCTVFP